MLIGRFTDEAILAIRNRYSKLIQLIIMNLLIHKKWWNFALVFTLFAGILIVASCSKKSHQMLPKEEKEINVIPSHSDIVFNYKLDKISIRDTFNRSIDEALEEAMSMMESNIEIEVKRSDDVHVEFAGRSVLVILPLDIEISRRTFIKTFRASGRLELTFISDLDIDRFWNLSTNTQINKYDWLVRPKLDMGVNIPITSITNRILNKYKGEIEKNIDFSIRQSFALRSRMMQNMRMFQEPIEAEESVGGWLQIIPTDAFISEVDNTRNWTVGKIAFRTNNIYSSKKPTLLTKPNILPPVEITNAIPDSSVIRLAVDLDIKSLSAQVRNNFKGQTFRDGNRSVTIQDVKIHTASDKLIATVQTTGTFKGTIVVSGTLKYDKEKNMIYAGDVIVNVKTRNILHQAASWLASGKIRKSFEEMLDIDLNENIQYLQKAINERVVSLKAEYDMDMKADIGSVTIEQMEISKESINLLLNFKTYLELKVFDLRSFNKFDW
jgi:hypothetical protein